MGGGGERTAGERMAGLGGGERTVELGEGERIAGYLNRLYIGHRSGTLL